MTVWKSLLVCAVFAVGSIAQAATLGPVIDSFRLADLLEAKQVKALETRSDEENYLAGHVPRSVFIPCGEFRGQKRNPGKLSESTQLASSLGARGIDTLESIVISVVIIDWTLGVPLDPFRAPELMAFGSTSGASGAICPFTPRAQE